MAVAAAGLVLLVGCGGGAARPVEDLGAGRDTSRFTLLSLRGTRDGDRLEVRAVFGETRAAAIEVDLRFAIGSPTRLESGTWSGQGGEGTVRERSVTFLGGQNGSPSIGGRFDLLAPDGSSRYRVTIPLQEIKTRL